MASDQAPPGLATGFDDNLRESLLYNNLRPMSQYHFVVSEAFTRGVPSATINHNNLDTARGSR
jgi:hypothetical protein